LTALSKLSAKVFEDSREMSYPCYDNKSTKSATSFYFG